MSRNLRLFLWALMALCIISTHVVNAQEDAEEEEGGEETEGDQEEVAEGEGEEPEQKGADDVYVTAILPNNRDSKLAAGNTIEALIGFENENVAVFNVEFIRGFLTSPQDSTYFAQNLTGQLYNTSVESGFEASLLYEFTPDAQIDPRDWGLIIEVFYADSDNTTYVQTAFNATITVTDPESSFDAKSLFAFLSVGGLIGFGAYMGSKMTKKGSRSRPKSTPTTAETGTDGVEWEFVDPRHRDFLRKRETSSPKGSPTSSDVE